MGMQTYLCPLCGGRHFLEIGGDAIPALGVIMQRLNTAHAKSVLRSAGVKHMPKAVKARDVKKLANRLVDRGADDFMAADPKMIGALVVHHVDGKTSSFVAQSGGEDLELTDVGGGFTVVRDTIDKSDPMLPRLFSDGVVRGEQLEKMDTKDFTTNCAAMKMLIAVAKSSAEVRRGAGTGSLRSSSPIAKLCMAEEVYRPFTSKLTPGWRIYTRGEFGDEETKTLAPSCVRCQQKVPVMICPVVRVRDNRVDLHRTAKAFVEAWERDCHSLPWGARGKRHEYV